MTSWDSVIAWAVGYADDTVGESITYTPADTKISAFTCQAQIKREEVMDLSGMGYEDRTTCRILHSNLSDNGVSEPTEGTGGKSGDKITATDPNGSTETWEIVGKSYDRNSKRWILEIAKNTRFEP